MVSASDDGECAPDGAVAAGEAGIGGLGREDEPGDETHTDARADHPPDGLDGPELHDDAEGVSVLGGGAVDLASDGGAGFEGDDPLGGEVVPGEILLTPERVVRRGHQAELVLDGGDGHELGGSDGLDGEGDNPQIELPGEDVARDLAGAGFAEGDADAGVVGEEGRAGAGEEGGGDGGAAPDADDAGFEPEDLSNGFSGAVGGSDGGLGVFEEGSPGGGESDAPSGPVQQGCAQLGFELFEHRAEGGLPDAEGLSGPGDVPFPGDRDELTEGGEFHGVMTIPEGRRARR